MPKKPESPETVELRGLIADQVARIFERNPEMAYAAGSTPRPVSAEPSRRDAMPALMRLLGATPDGPSMRAFLDLLNDADPMVRMIVALSVSEINLGQEIPAVMERAQRAWAIVIAGRREASRSS